MSQLIREEMLLGINAFQRTSSVPAVAFAIGVDLMTRVGCLARHCLTRTARAARS